MKNDFLLGNGCIALGLLEAGCEVITAYPGTPSSEIIPEITKLMQEETGMSNYVEWSINEKVAFDNAFAAAIAGKRAACCMKQVGLNVASDSLMSSAYLGTKGGFVIISCDDPGPHSSQTEQDSRIMARLAKIPVFDPALPDEARKMIKHAFDISEEFELPIIVRPTTRVCHAKQIAKWKDLNKNTRKSVFVKNPERWASTPNYRLKQHRILNTKLKEISKKFDNLILFNNDNLKPNTKYPVGIISSGVPGSVVAEMLKENNRIDIPILKLGAPYPLPKILTDNFLKNCDKVLILEETDTLIEYLVARSEKVLGRISGHVPNEGELTPEKIENILNNFLSEHGLNPLTQKKESKLLKKVTNIKLPTRKPSLCAGCPHRASFFAIRKAKPKAIFTSDIGCYTLGMNMGGVDTCVDMGAAITIASGLHQSFKKDGINQPIIATIGDSTFIHSGTTGLINAVYNKSRFVLVILDNNTIAMTGMQPSPPSGILANGKSGIKISLERIIHGCGVNYIEVLDPYDTRNMVYQVKEALNFTKKSDGEMAVIIARHPCLVAYKKEKISKKTDIYITEKCDGCNFCHDYFQCPALNKTNKTKTFIDKSLCTKCGVCINICPKKAIKKDNHLKKKGLCE